MHRLSFSEWSSLQIRTERSQIVAGKHVGRAKSFITSITRRLRSDLWIRECPAIVRFSSGGPRRLLSRQTYEKVLPISTPVHQAIPWRK